MKIDNSVYTEPRIGPALKPALESENDSKRKGFAGGFEKIFDDLWKASAEKSAPSRADTAKLIMGELDDLAAMKVTGEKSSILFEYNLNVRNKVIDAYTEIMRTQV